MNGKIDISIDLDIDVIENDILREAANVVGMIISNANQQVSAEAYFKPELIASTCSEYHIGGKDWKGIVKVETTGDK